MSCFRKIAFIRFGQSAPHATFSERYVQLDNSLDAVLMHSIIVQKKTFTHRLIFKQINVDVGFVEVVFFSSHRLCE